MTEIRIGVADADSGLNLASLSIHADFVVNGAAAGTELKGQGSFVAPGVFSIPFQSPISNLSMQHLTAAIADKQGNTNIVKVRFWIDSGFHILALDSSALAAGSLTLHIENPSGSTNHVVLMSRDAALPMGQWTTLPVSKAYDEPGGVRGLQVQIPAAPPPQLYLRVLQN